MAQRWSLERGVTAVAINYFYHKAYTTFGYTTQHSLYRETTNTSHKVLVKNTREEA
jgi:hypothetical protein